MSEIVLVGAQRRKNIRQELVDAYFRAIRRGDHLAASRIETVIHARKIAPCHYRVCGEVDTETGIRMIDRSHFPSHAEILASVPDIVDPEGEFPAIPEDAGQGEKKIQIVRP